MLPTAYLKSRRSTMVGCVLDTVDFQVEHTLGGQRALARNEQHTMSDKAMEQLARESVDAFNRGDWQAIRHMAHPNYVYEEASTGQRTESIDDAISGFAWWKASAPDVTGEIHRVVVDGDTTVVEIKWRGTQTGPLGTGRSELPASGRSFDFWATMWQVWQDGKLAEQRHHNDLWTMLAQIGAIATSGLSISLPDARLTCGVAPGCEPHATVGT